MTERSLTLLEIHLGDAQVQLGPKTLGTATDEHEDETTVSEVADSANCPGRVVGKAVLFGLFIVALAVIVWKVLGNSDLEAAEELDTLSE